MKCIMMKCNDCKMNFVAKVNGILSCPHCESVNTSKEGKPFIFNP